jgi:hypothetical protein
VDPQTVRINGAEVGEGLALAGTLKRSPGDFLRDDLPTVSACRDLGQLCPPATAEAAPAEHPSPPSPGFGRSTPRSPLPARSERPTAPSWSVPVRRSIRWTVCPSPSAWSCSMPPTSARWATAKRLGQEAGALQVTYLATRFERRLGWDGLTSVEDALDAPVFLLTPDVRARFALERVLAFVEARGNHFLVAEALPEAAP